eukprot:6127589-Ditylum_brightwellii.AAC.1
MKLVEQFSPNRNMSFGLDKYAIFVIKNSHNSTTNILPQIPKLDNDTNKGYQYLGIIEGTNFLIDEVKLKNMKEYISRVSKNSQFSSSRQCHDNS